MGKWMKTMAIAMGLPSTTLAVALITHELVKSGKISEAQGICVFLFILVGSLLALVYEAYKDK